MFKLVFFVPAASVEEVKNALFEKGAGQDAHYSHSAWQVLGQMQYKPLENSHPAKGNKGELIKSDEYRVEMICQKQFLQAVVTELLKVHPYEKPAYEIYTLEQL